MQKYSSKMDWKQLLSCCEAALAGIYSDVYRFNHPSLSSAPFSYCCYNNSDNLYRISHMNELEIFINGLVIFSIFCLPIDKNVMLESMNQNLKKTLLLVN